MAKLVSDVLDECSRMLVNHQSWAYLDKMTDRAQLEVINEYNDQQSKYIVIVFEKNEQAKKHFERCEELGLNQDEDQGFHKEEMEEEWLENNP